ncbi:MAG TPA: tetratricopeptide repeat protein [Polyangiaceae bacterium]|nr:tetratricopeptide repeat protein [Polyangiaceae bacterium]
MLAARSSFRDSWISVGLWVGLASAGLSGAGCAAPANNVTRIARGIEHKGREISDLAYALYARGAVWEAQGHLDEALTAYTKALDEDPGAPELLARIGAVRCKRSQSGDGRSLSRALEDFERALRWDPENSLAYEELSRCHTRHAQYARALRAALEAVSHDPQAEHLSLLVAEAAQAAGDGSTADRWLDATVTWHPNSIAAWLAFERHASRRRDPIRLLRSRRALERLGGARLDPDRFQAKRDPRRLPPADAARSHSPAAESSPETGAAKRAFEANPDDAEAWVKLLVSADLAGQSEDFERYLRAAPQDPGSLSANAAQDYAVLLERWVDTSARRAWEAQQLQTAGSSVSTTAPTAAPQSGQARP